MGAGAPTPSIAMAPDREARAEGGLLSGTIDHRQWDAFAALFDTEAFTRKLEAAYISMMR